MLECFANNGTRGLPVGLHFKALKKLYSNAAGSTMSRCDRVKTIFTDQCLQSTVEMIGAKVSEMAVAC